MPLSSAGSLAGDDKVLEKDGLEEGIMIGDDGVDKHGESGLGGFRLLAWKIR